MASSAIINIKFQKELNTNGGVMSVYELTFENGDTGEYIVKELKKKKGDTMEYELTPNKNPKYLGRIKEITASAKAANQNYVPNPAGSITDAGENARTALNVAKDLILAGKVDMKATDLAEKLFSWLEKHSKQNS